MIDPIEVNKEDAHDPYFVIAIIAVMVGMCACGWVMCSAYYKQYWAAPGSPHNRSVDYPIHDWGYDPISDSKKYEVVSFDRGNTWYSLVRTEDRVEIIKTNAELSRMLTFSHRRLP